MVATGDAPGAGEDAVLHFVEELALVLAAAGMPRMPARAFALLLASDSGRLSARELADRLRVSPAAVSGAVRYLVTTDLARRGRRPGERVDHYALGEGSWYEAMSTRTEVFTALTASLERGGAAVRDGSPAQQRILETRDFFAYLGEQLPLLVERWRAGRA